MQHTKNGRTLTDLILEIFRVNGAIINAGNDLIKDLGLTSARWQVLGALTEGPATVSDIARHMWLSRQNVQRIANQLIKDGFIETKTNPAHRRAKLCSLSPSGKEAMNEITKRQMAWANEFSKNMNLEKLTTAVSEVKHIRENLTKSHEVIE
ncbi:MarR family winged helix-turn-helix transcriptional regulator [Desulfoluna spongiiphila]|uniref:MarR family winged helix-turn-helix transcriptional regulator n=1 Tax=Desulfoluna spongiiphila TaxID=419481 RepID=UPI00125C82EA|nr:MarR family transcriptional regulator [Desulfoluna spongiiphila]VVS92605.1 marr-type hth domain [Desulfoluna spongiiphila]